MTDRKEYQRKWYAENRERRLAQQAEYRAKTREARREYMRKYRAENREACKEYDRQKYAAKRDQYAVYYAKYRADNRKRRMVAEAKKRAEKRGVPFNITVEYVESIWPKDNRCPILGYELKAGSDSGIWCSPSLDRIIPELGYVEGNVRVCSHRANSMKHDADGDTLIKFANWILENVKTS